MTSHSKVLLIGCVLKVNVTTWPMGGSLLMRVLTMWEILEENARTTHSSTIKTQSMLAFSPKCQ